MPELPEVETVRRTLAPAVGAKIRGTWTSGHGLHMAREPPRAKLAALAGATFTRIHRHGKYLLLETDTPLTLLVHLGMTGRTLLLPRDAPPAKHTHVVVDLGDRELRFIDARRFGQVDVVERGKESEHAGLAALGPDGWFEPVSAAYLFAKSRAKQTTLKAFVLDQSIVAGVGNIYASEALWRARLRPTTRAHHLTRASAQRLAAAIHEAFARALAKGGTSLRDFVDATGAYGENDAHLWVYGREGEPCPRDRTKIRRSLLQGRVTFYCPTCQTR